MTQWFMRVGNIGFNLILLNILWLAGLVSGLVVLGLFPATIAVVAVVKHIVLVDDNPHIVKLFLKHFKTHFLMANIFGYVMGLVGVVLIVDLMWIWQLESGLLQQAMFGLSILISVIYLLACVYLFPIYLHYQFTFKEYLIQPIILVVGKPLQTVLLLVIMTLIITLYVIFPALLCIFGVSALIYPIVTISCKSFNHKEAHDNNEVHYSQETN